MCQLCHVAIRNNLNLPLVSVALLEEPDSVLLAEESLVGEAVVKVVGRGAPVVVVPVVAATVLSLSSTK